MPEFETLNDAAEYAIKNIEPYDIEKFILNENAKLAMPLDEIEEIIKITIEQAESLKAKTPEDYLRDFIATDIQGKTKLTAIKEFIRCNMMDEREDTVEAFIIERNLGLRREETANIKSFYKTERKHKKENEVKTLRSLVKQGVNTDVSSEFQGLYEVTENQKTGAISYTPKVDLIADRVISKMHVIMYSGNCFCFKDGYYQNNLKAVKEEAMRILKGICKGTSSNGISSMLNDTITIITNTNLVMEYPFNKHNNALPVKNGIVVFDFENNSIEVEKHNPGKWKFNYILPINFEKNNVNDTILTELQKYTPDYKTLVQAIAQALLQTMGYGPYKKAYLLKGKKNCGKTTFLDIVECIIGEKNKSKVALSELTPQFRFARSDMEGKLVNIDDDLGYFKMSETGVFKKLTGGYSQRIEKKGVDAYDVHITAVHIFTTNTPAGFDQRIFLDDAFWERWAYIEFEHTFEKDDEFKKRVLTEENISGFFNNILEMMVEIRSGKKLPYIQNWYDVRDKWMQESNVLYKFIEENMVTGGRTAIMKDDLLAAVTKFCLDEKYDNKLIPKNHEELGDMVLVCGGSKDDQRTFKGSSHRVDRCFILN